jgi:hypothetical protein
MKLEQQEHNVFNKPSILVNIAHSVDISLNSLKIYNYIIRELFKTDIEKNTTILTTYKHLANSLNYNSNYSSKEIQMYLIELGNTSIKTKTWNYLRNDWKDNLMTHLLSSITYNHDNQEVKIEISQGLRDLILKYRETFAKLDIEELKKIKSKHTLKLYELFKDYSYHKNHKMKTNIIDLFEYLNIPKNSEYRNNISIFNRNILKKAINEINAKSYMNIEYKYYRANKSNTEAYYLFSIQDILRYSFNRFKASMIELIKIKPRTFNYKNKKYDIELLENKKTENYMLINSITGKTVDTELAQEIWQYIYKEVNYNTLNFFDSLNLDFEDFNTIYENLKKKNNIRKVITETGKEVEIIEHKNQTYLEV